MVRNNISGLTYSVTVIQSAVIKYFFVFTAFKCCKASSAAPQNTLGWRMLGLNPELLQHIILYSGESGSDMLCNVPTAPPGIYLIRRFSLKYENMLFE
jgi:hypothetical protein